MTPFKDTKRCSRSSKYLLTKRTSEGVRPSNVSVRDVGTGVLGDQPSVKDRNVPIGRPTERLSASHRSS